MIHSGLQHWNCHVLIGTKNYKKIELVKELAHMKKFLPWILASGGIMLGLPCLAVTFLEDDSGMATCLILLFALNPIYAICAGVYAGKDIKKLWASPILTALFFLAGTWLFLDIGEKAFLLYALVYLFLGILAMLISMFLKKKH